MTATTAKKKAFEVGNPWSVSKTTLSSDYLLVLNRNGGQPINIHYSDLRTLADALYYFDKRWGLEQKMLTVIKNEFPMFRIGAGLHPSGGLFLRIDLGRIGVRLTRPKKAKRGDW